MLVDAGVTRSSSFFRSATENPPEVSDPESDPGPWSSSLVFWGVAWSEEVGPVAVRERTGGALVAAEVRSFAGIAASAAFLFLVEGGVVKEKCLWQAGMC